MDAEADRLIAGEGRSEDGMGITLKDEVFRTQAERGQYGKLTVEEIAYLKSPQFREKTNFDFRFN